jgi:hypothetical protein
MIEHTSGSRARVRTILENIDTPKSAEMRAFQTAAALMLCIRHDFTGSGKTKFFEGDGLQAVRK